VCMEESNMSSYKFKQSETTCFFFGCFVRDLFTWGNFYLAHFKPKWRSL
jgi:hypothetical protein